MAVAQCKNANSYLVRIIFHVKANTQKICGHSACLLSRSTGGHDKATKFVCAPIANILGDPPEVFEEQQNRCNDISLGA